MLTSASANSQLAGVLGGLLITAIALAPEDIRSYSFLADLGGWLTFAAAMTTTLILTENAIDYLRFMFGHRPDFWLVTAITTAAACVIVVDFVRIYLRTKSLSAHQIVARVLGRYRTTNGSRAALTQGSNDRQVILAIVGSWLVVSLAASRTTG